MKLRHGQLWRRLGPAVLSGILIASLAPSTIAAPIDGQDMHSDAESANLGLKDKKSWSEPDLSALRCEKVWFKVVGGQL